MDQQAQTARQPLLQRGQPGQALIEYALILVLVVIALAAALIATGPALGNVFSNTVYNLIGEAGTPQPNLVERGAPSNFWLTVTAVALNPPSERPMPTNPPREPTSTFTPGPSPTPTPITPTPTPSLTPTERPTSTPTDAAFSAPFYDPIDRPAWWRVDSSVYLGGDDWRGEYYPNTSLSGEPIVRWNAQLAAEYKYNIAFDWGTGGPIDGWLVDNFSVRWTRNIYVAGTQDITVQATITSIGGVRFWVDSTQVANDWSNRTFDSDPIIITFNLTPGNHTLRLEYYVGGGNAAVFLNLNRFRGNVLADTALPSGPPNCQWMRVTGSQPNTIAWAWKESQPGLGTGFPPNLRCHLELRGYIDVSSLSNPQMSFYDVWDFGAATTARLQIAEYQPYNPDGTGGPNWAAGMTVTLRTGGTNYAWTRNQVPIPNVPSKRITYRFILESGSGSGTRRWYIDDIEVRDMPTRTFTVCSGSTATCNNFWNLESTAQKGDFVTTGRWDLTSRSTADNSALAWDVSGGTNYVRFGREQPSGQNRIHAIEFNGLISLPYNADGTGGLPDWEGNDGFPLLVFQHAYDIDRGTTLAIQWTRDPVDSTPDTWQTLETIISATSSTAAQPMMRREVELRNIPNWNTSPFRLRFAMLVDNSRTPSRPGWWIDNITFARRGIPRFSAYPFCDDAESGTDKWLMTGQWGLAVGGAAGSSRAFTDSPAGLYLHGQQTAMELRYPIDFNNDTPENLTNWGGNRDCLFGNPGGAATEPILTFLHWRDVNANENIFVDIMRPAHAPSGTARIDWTLAWAYYYLSGNRRQYAWEPVEVNLRAAIEQATGQTWSALRTNANPYDDDFYFRIRFDARSDSSVADGVYVDNIDIRNYSEVSHKLWDISRDAGPGLGNGNGPRYVDNVDAPPEWWLRWGAGGTWSATGWNAPDPSMPYWWDAFSGEYALTDSPPFNANYRARTFNVLNMTRIIDLRGTRASDNPTLFFWNHYNVGSSAAIRVQVAVEDAARTTQAYNYVYGWGSSTSYASSSSWETIWSRTGATRVDTWVREQVSLSNYVGRRIRVRFVLDAMSASSGLTDGWYIDDIRFENYQPLVRGLPFFDGAQNTANWVTEGLWGLAPDLWKGSGGGPAALGPDTWKQYFMKCINASNQLTTCDPTSANTFLNGRTPTEAAMDAYVAANLAANPPRVLPKTTVNDITNDFGSTGRPLGAPLGAAGAFWDDNYVGRWLRTITVQGGEYTFITTSDDGVRVRVEPAATFRTSPPYTWNVINNWSYHSRTVDLRTMTLAAGDYGVVVEWFEGSGDAVIILQVGNNNFSFSDSPKASATADSVLSVPYGNSSLMLNGLINLNRPTGTPESLWTPKLQYYTFYQLGSSSSAVVEISIDGGLTWTTANLNQNCPSGAACDPFIWGWTDWMPPSRDWQWRVHDLRSYANRPGGANFIGLRFRLNTTSSVRDGWWITEIQVNN